MSTKWEPANTRTLDVAVDHELLADRNRYADTMFLGPLSWAHPAFRFMWLVKIHLCHKHRHWLTVQEDNS